MEKQTVFKHLLLHKKHKENKIIWKILHSNVRNDEERRCIEAFEIKNYKQLIMNSCIGRTICIQWFNFNNFNIFISHLKSIMDFYN